MKNVRKMRKSGELYVHFLQKECEFFVKYVYNAQRICYNSSAEGKARCEIHRKGSSLDGRIAGASGKVFATRGSLFCYCKEE